MGNLDFGIGGNPFDRFVARRRRSPIAKEIREWSDLFEPTSYFEPESVKNFTQKDMEAGHVKDPYYGISRDCLVRNAVEMFISYPNEKSERGILLIQRNGNPAKGQM